MLLIVTKVGMARVIFCINNDNLPFVYINIKSSVQMKENLKMNCDKN